MQRGVQTVTDENNTFISNAHKTLPIVYTQVTTHTNNEREHSR